MSNSKARQRLGITSVGPLTRLVKMPATSNRAWPSSRVRVPAKPKPFQFAASNPKAGSVKVLAGSNRPRECKNASSKLKCVRLVHHWSRFQDLTRTIRISIFEVRRMHLQIIKV